MLKMAAAQHTARGTRKVNEWESCIATQGTNRIQENATCRYRNILIALRH